MSQVTDERITNESNILMVGEWSAAHTRMVALGGTFEHRIPGWAASAGEEGRAAEEAEEMGVLCVCAGCVEGRGVWQRRK